MKRLFAILCGCSTILLTGCTDIRSRRYADILAVTSGKEYSASLRCDGEETWYTAAAAAPKLLPTALENELGAQLSMGHLGLLMLQGDTLEPLTALLDDGQLVPTCPVLLCPKTSQVERFVDSNLAAQLQRSMETGLLPRRTVGDVYGDLRSAARITLLPCLVEDALTLAVSDGAQTLAILSEDACRGAALLCGRWDHFAFVEMRGASPETIRLKSCKCKLHMEQKGERLVLSVELSPEVESGDAELARTAVCRMLRAYFQEAVTDCAADACFLEETALRCGISIPDTAAWRALLRDAEIQVTAH